MGRHANPDIRRAFAEFQDTDTPSKCNKVRCLHCGFVRAKNTTRQIEHLNECQAFLNSPDAQQHIQNTQNASGDGAQQQSGGSGNILTGQHPNPNLQVHRRGPNAKRNRDGQLIAPHANIAPNVAPSLTAHLLASQAAAFQAATQQNFLSHAGCGSLAAGPLSQWLAQDAHYTRGYIRFVGQLLAKVRLPQTPNAQFHPMFRTMDLLISALNNMRREMQFFEITATKFGLNVGPEPPTPITRALLDLFVSASSTSASLLEGMVVLWGVEHVYRSAWQYAASFHTSMSTPMNEPHIVALHQALIPNWTSPAFSKFVDACRALVDELANSNSARDGREEMLRCEEIFRQICYLEERFWPDVDGMGEVDETGRLGSTGIASMGGNVGGMDNNSNMNNAGINSSGSAMNTGMNGQGMNGPAMNNQAMNTPNMNANMNTNMNPQGINGQAMNNQGMNGQTINTQGMNGQSMNTANMSAGDSTPSDGRASFGTLDGVEKID